MFPRSLSRTLQAIADEINDARSLARRFARSPFPTPAPDRTPPAPISVVRVDHEEI